MYASLPDIVKQQVLRYLSADNFTAAKQIHDEWMAHHENSKNAFRHAEHEYSFSESL